jgi:hypothetical protein
LTKNATDAARIAPIRAAFIAGRSRRIGLSRQGADKSEIPGGVLERPGPKPHLRLEQIGCRSKPVSLYVEEEPAEVPLARIRSRELHSSKRSQADDQKKEGKPDMLCAELPAGVDPYRSRKAYGSTDAAAYVRAELRRGDNEQDDGKEDNPPPD